MLYLFFQWRLGLLNPGTGRHNHKQKSRCTWSCGPEFFFRGGYAELIGKLSQISIL